MKYSLVFLLLSFLPAIHCLQAQQARQSHPASQAFQMITIPNTLTEPEERAIYLVEHYWDNFDFQDTSYIDKPEALEQALVDYLDLARYVPSDTMAASVTIGLEERGTVHPGAALGHPVASNERSR